MIPVDLLRRVTVVYTHAHCPDGLASAMILKDAFRMLGMSPRIEFLTHNTQEHRAATPYTRWQDAPEGTECGVALFCDFAPHPYAFHVDRHASWKDAVEHVGPHTIVLDHHKGAEEVVRAFGELGVFADEKLDPGVSGAVLAFREVWLAAYAATYENALPIMPSGDAQHDKIRDFALCVGARDTWQTQDTRFQRGQRISKMLMARPADYWMREGGNPFLTEIQIDIGAELFHAHEEVVRQAVEQAVRYEVGEEVNDFRMTTHVLFVFQEQSSGFRLCSDVAEEIRRRNEAAKGHLPLLCVERFQQAVVAGFSYVVDKPGAAPRLVYSLRGLNGFDVAAFAKANGGGGHTAAAGFSVDAKKMVEWEKVTPYEFIQDLLEDFLERR